jgi:hypothetical protein
MRNQYRAAKTRRRHLFNSCSCTKQTNRPTDAEPPKAAKAQVVGMGLHDN